MTRTHRKVFAEAWPVILANASTPLLGLVDTAVLGRGQHAQGLAGLALAVMIFNFLYWSCGFLRMSTTGFVAQSSGANRPDEVAATAARGLMLGIGIGLVFILTQGLIASVAFSALQGDAQTESAAAEYFALRIWGAPATLSLYVYSGLLIGLGRTRALLAMQLILNLLNGVLDLWLGHFLGWQLQGVAIGTVASEWLVCLGATALLARPGRLLLGAHQSGKPLWRLLTARQFLVPALRNHRDIFLRTLFMLFGFAWFTNVSAGFGALALAANHILLQLVSFSAFFLDGFAFVAEARVGRAIGARNPEALHRAVRVTSECSALIALGLAGFALFAGPYVIHSLTDLADIRTHAQTYLPFAALYILCSFAAFQLDGIFIGATAAPAMRNASMLAFAVFVATWWLTRSWQLTGLWLSFIGYVLARAVFLLGQYRQVTHSITLETSTGVERR